MEPGLCLAEYEVTDSQQEGLTNDVLESCLHGAGYLGRVQLQHFGQDWYSWAIHTGNHHGDPGSHEQDGPEDKRMFRISTINVEINPSISNIYVISIYVSSIAVLSASE